MTGDVSLTRRLVTSVAIGALSLVVAVAGTMLTAWLADEFHWCCVHSWAMVHDTGIIVLMAWGLVGFHLVSAFAERFDLALVERRFGLLPHICYVGAALGSWSSAEKFVWIGLAAGLLAIVNRLRGRKVEPFGLVVVGMGIGVLVAARWVMMWNAFHAVRR